MNIKYLKRLEKEGQVGNVRSNTCPMTKNQLSSIDFVVNRFFMNLFKSSNIAVINECQKMFYFQLPSERLSHRTSRFLLKVALVNNNFIMYTTHV